MQTTHFDVQTGTVSYFFQEHGMTQPNCGIHQELYTQVLHLFEHLDEKSTNTARGMPHHSTCSCEDEVGTKLTFRSNWVERTSSYSNLTNHCI